MNTSIALPLPVFQVPSITLPRINLSAVKPMMRVVLLILLFFVSPSLALAQLIKGRVVDEQHPDTPLAGASVQLPDGKQGVITDSSGRFSIRPAQAVLFIRVSFLGYRTQTVSIEDDNPDLTIRLVSDDARNLAEVTVRSKYYKQYATNTISSALRLQTPLLNLPQHIQTITPEIIYDQASFNMTEGVSRNVSGVVRQEVSNNLGPYLFMRGGQIATLRNGIDLTPIYRGPSPEDAAIIDRVEFIKGPSLFMNNIGDAAGSFNVVTKQPTGVRRYSATAMLGNFAFYRLAVDLDGQLDKKGKLLYRLNGMGMGTNSFVKFDDNQRFLVAPVLKYRLSDRTYVSAEYMYQQFRYGMGSPIVMTPTGFATLPIDFSISEPSLTPYHVSDNTGFLTLVHQFNANWQLTARSAFMRNDNEGAYMWVTGVNAANPTVLLRNPKYDLNRTEVFSQQAFVNGRLTTGGIKHQFLAGVDVNQKRFRANSYISYDTYTDAQGKAQLTYYPLDINNPVYGTDVPNYHTPGGLINRNTTQTIDYHSLYALDELALFSTKLRLTLGLRYTSIQTNNDVSGVLTTSSDNVATPRLGISYSLRPDLSVYALYDQTLVPQAGVTSSGEAIRPQQGINREIGVKKNWLNGRWNTTLAYYRINRSNAVATDPNNSLYRVQVGENHAEGIDLDMVGQVARGLNVVVNYAYNDSRIDNDVTTALIGTPTPMYVKHIQNTWLNYELPLASLPGLNLSLGYQYQGGRGERYATATQHTIPDFFRLDGGVGWQVHAGQRNSVKVNLLVNNLLNKTLIATAWYRSGLYYWVPQAPINGRLSMSYTF